MRERLRDEQEAFAKKNGLPIREDDSHLVAERFHEARKVNSVTDSEFRRTKVTPYYYYNFFVKGGATNVASQENAFRELGKFFEERPALAKKVGLNEFDIPTLLEGRETRGFIFHNKEGESGVMQLMSIAPFDDDED